MCLPFPSALVLMRQCSVYVFGMWGRGWEYKQWFQNMPVIYWSPSSLAWLGCQVGGLQDLTQLWMKVQTKGEGWGLGHCVLVSREVQGNKCYFSNVGSQQNIYGIKLNFHRGFWGGNVEELHKLVRSCLACWAASSSDFWRRRCRGVRNCSWQKRLPQLSRSLSWAGTGLSWLMLEFAGSWLQT